LHNTGHVIIKEREINGMEVSHNPCYRLASIFRKKEVFFCGIYGLDQWYSTFFVRVPPDIIYLQLCTPKVVGV
jgi:hypothetical protein